MKDYKIENSVYKVEERQSGYSIISTELLNDSRLKDRDKLVFARLTSLTQDGKNYAFCGNKYLAERHGVKERSIQDSLARLKQYGYIEIEIEKSKKGTYRKIYTLVNRGGGMQNNAYGGASECIRGMQNNAPQRNSISINSISSNNPHNPPKGDERELQTEIERFGCPKEKNTTPPPKACESEKKKVAPKKKRLRFEKWWDLYGKKIDRGKCERKFVKYTEAEIDLIFEHTRWYLATMYDDPPNATTAQRQYQRYPSTYLNNENWKNENWREEDPNEIRRAKGQKFARKSKGDSTHYKDPDDISEYAKGL